MRNLNPDQLQTFVAVLEAGGFTHAARRLHLTQPAVSLQIRELETRCGVKLLERDGRRPKPTPAGQDLYEAALRILGEQSAAMVQMRRHRDTALGRVRFGLSTTSLSHFAGPALRKARGENPTLQIIVNIGTSRELTQAVDAGELDLAVVTLPVVETGLVVTPLVADPLVAILPARMDDLPDAITPGWMAGHPFVAEARHAALGELVRAWFNEAKVEPDVIMRLEHLAAMQAAVDAGLGVSIVPAMLAKAAPPTLHVRPLSPAISRHLGLIEQSSSNNPAMTKLKSYLHELT